MICTFIAQVVSACKNDGSSVVNPTNSTKLVVINTSPDAGPVAVFIDNFQLGKGSDVAAALRTYFKYSSTPTYYGVGTGSLLLQLRKPIVNTNISTDTLVTLADKSYSLFLMGLASVDSLRTVILRDTTALPTLGNGKIRFLNTSPRTPPLDVYINGTLGFTKIKYTGVSNLIQLPAGMYEFKLTANGAPSSVLTTLSRVTIQDGKLYTLYTKGMVGRTDSAAVGLNVISNK